MDNVLAENGLDKIDPKVGYIPARNFIKANEILVQPARKNLEKGKIVILDACFYHKEAIEDIISNLLPYKSFVFTLKAPLHICIERDRNRPRSYGKIAVNEVYKLVTGFDYGNVIEVSKPIGETVSELLSHLPKN